MTPRAASKEHEQMNRMRHHVALALVHRDGAWLVARRFADVHLGGQWEFPGGKCEPGENPADAAVRELHEECAVTATPQRALAVLCCDYGDRIVHLYPIICCWRAGEARPLGNEECRWVSRAELAALDMPDVNRAIIAALPEG